MEYFIAKYDVTTAQNPATELCHETVLPKSSFQLSVLMSSMNACISLVIFISVRFQLKVYVLLFLLNTKNVCGAHFNHLDLTPEQ
jgi:hypothetical protein